MAYTFYNMTVEPSDDGKELTIKVALDQGSRKSQSGKTNTIATTGKPKEIMLENGDAVMIGCNVFQYPDRK